MENHKVELVPPRPTGNRAVVQVNITVLVEVQETDSWNDMVEQATEQLRKRVVEGKGFLPFRSQTELIHDKTTVDVLKGKLTIDPRKEW